MKLFNAKSLILTAVLFAAAVAQAHVEPGSFLNRPARNTGQLINETRSDSQVRERFMRHFRMSESDLLDMFSGLHPSTLKQGGSYIVYNIHEDNVIRARVFNLKRGTLVFVDANGRPILKISCGNPMIAPTPKVALKLKPGVSAKPHPMPTPGVVPAEVPTTEIMPPTPIAPPPVVPAQPIYEKIVSGNVYESKSTSSLFVLPLLLFINTHSKCCDTQKQPVPEPASMLVMGFGASWMMLRKRRKNHAKV